MLNSQIGQLKVELDWLKKYLDYPVDRLRTLIDPGNSQISIARQCDLLGLNRSSFYNEAEPVSDEDHDMMRRIDELYLEYPFLGSRRMAEMIGRQLNCNLSRKRMQRLMRIMGIQAIYPKPNLSKPNADHKIYPYLLRGVAIKHPITRCGVAISPTFHLKVALHILLQLLIGTRV
jgi:putative transposase